MNSSKRPDRRSILMLLTTVCIGLTWLQCGREAGPSADDPVIALVMKTLNHPYFLDMQRGAKEAARNLNIRLVIQAAEREIDVEKQMQIVENMIQRRVSALCIAPSGSREIVPVIVKANRAGIPVLIVDTRVDQKALREAGGEIAGFVGSDNLRGGQVAGEYLVEHLNGRGKVAILEGIPGHETGDSRLRGFHQVIRNHPGIQVLSSQTANWERALGYTVFQNMLQAQPDIEALFSCSDMMALGAIEAIAEAGREGSIVVVGFDAASEAREAVRQGRLLASVAQFPYDMGKRVVENAVEVLKGNPIEQDVEVPIRLITKEVLDAETPPNASGTGPVKNGESPG